jgi:hypothetical protein
VRLGQCRLLCSTDAVGETAEVVVLALSNVCENGCASVSGIVCSAHAPLRLLLHGHKSLLKNIQILICMFLSRLKASKLAEA